MAQVPSGASASMPVTSISEQLKSSPMMDKVKDEAQKCTTCGSKKKKKIDPCTGKEIPEQEMRASDIKSQKEWDQRTSDFKNGINPTQRRVIDAYDKAMAPWQHFNDIFGGAASPAAGGNTRPGYTKF